VTTARFDRLDVTPFIDVLLVMLILFMIAVPATERPLSGSLPESGDGTGHAPPRVRVSASALWLDGEPQAGIETLAAGLRERFARGGDGVLLVEADDGTPYQRVVAVVDAATGAGAFRVGLLERPSGDRAEADPTR